MTSESDKNTKQKREINNKFVQLIIKHKFITFLVIFALLISLSISISYAIAGVEGIKRLGSFISDQLLGMKWLNDLFNTILTAIFGVEFMQTKWGGMILFFFYDVVKIFALLSTMIFIITYIQSYFPPKRTKEILGGKKGIFANTLGALLGTVTPFCSCSSIPIFIGFTKAGVNTGVAFSFLISSPLVDLGALILLASVFGFPIAITYVVVGLVLAIIGGTLIDKFVASNHIKEQESFEDNELILELSVKDRMKYALYGVGNTIKKVWLFILIGVGVGAVIHNIIPSEWINQVLGEDKWYSVIVATLVGAPIYADIFGVIPIAEALFAKGAGIGTILSFMMSVTALSIPSMIMLSKVVKTKMMIAFISIVILGIVLIGYIFNAIGFLLV